MKAVLGTLQSRDEAKKPVTEQTVLLVTLDARSESDENKSIWTFEVLSSFSIPSVPGRRQMVGINLNRASS